MFTLKNNPVQIPDVRPSMLPCVHIQHHRTVASMETFGVAGGHWYEIPCYRIPTLCPPAHPAFCLEDDFAAGYDVNVDYCNEVPLYYESAVLK